MRTLRTARVEYDEIKQHNYYVYTCSKCGEEILCRLEEALKEKKFEPKEIESEGYKLSIDETTGCKTITPEMVKLSVSSDINKDTYTFKCPICGNMETVEYGTIKGTNCDGTGYNRIIFELNDNETKQVKEFIESHKNCCEEKLGKKFFSSSGGQFTYTITPTGLGDIVNIKCNACKENKDITNTKDW